MRLYLEYFVEVLKCFMLYSHMRTYMAENWNKSLPKKLLYLTLQLLESLYDQGHHDPGKVQR